MTECASENIYISVVSPVYGCAAAVPDLCRRLRTVLGEISHCYEIILVEDASPDTSWERIREECESDPRIVGIKLSRNFGQHCAITAGLDYARGEWVVVMDCDLQDQPEEITKLYAKAQEGYDIVFARRANRQDPWTKTLPGDIFGWVLAWLTGIKGDRSVANFSVSCRTAIEAFRVYRERNRAFPLIMHQIGFRRTYVDVAHAPRLVGHSSYTLRKLLNFAVQVVIASSTRPLHMSIRFGAIVAGLSALYALFLISRYFFADIVVAGWTSLAVLISFFFGLLFVQLGVIGLYVGEVLEESKHRPLYHVAVLNKVQGRQNDKTLHN